MRLIARIPVTAALLALLLGSTTGCNKLKARDQLGKGVTAFKNNKYEEAVGHFQNAIQLDPDYAEALFRRGIVRRLNGDKAGGDADVAAAKKMDSDLVE